MVYASNRNPYAPIVTLSPGEKMRLVVWLPWEPPAGKSGPRPPTSPKLDPSSSADSTSEGSNFRTGAQDSGEGGKPEESPGGIASAQPRARR